jgi:hypothetical protein
MGQTLLPCSQLIEGERRRWAPFTRALPKADQAIFERLFGCVDRHCYSGTAEIHTKIGHSPLTKN